MSQPTEKATNTMKYLTMHELFHHPKVTWIFPATASEPVVAVPHDTDLEPTLFTVEPETSFWLTNGENIAQDGSELWWLGDMDPGVYVFTHECDDPDPHICGADDADFKRLN